LPSNKIKKEKYLISKMSEKGHNKNSLEYIPLCEASRESGYTPEYLNSLARRGKLKAKKIGRNWYTTPAWIEDFISGTRSAKKEKIEKINSEIQEYCLNGKHPVHPEKTGTLPSMKAENEQSLRAISSEEFRDEVRGIIADEKKSRRLEKDSQSIEARFKARVRSANFFAAALAAVFLLFGIFQAGRVIDFGGIRFGSVGENFDEEYGGEYPGWISSEDGVVKGEETISGEIKGAAMASENFQVREIKFGGAIALASAQENLNLEIYDVRSEVMATKGKEESRLLVKWKTSKPAVSSIEYATMGGGNPKKLIEDSYGFGHSVVLANLEPGTAYTYVIGGKDKWANEASSDRYSAYTGTRTVSVFDLIVNAVKEVFGWAVE
jgi:hypothetical protein